MAKKPASKTKKKTSKAAAPSKKTVKKTAARTTKKTAKKTAAKKTASKKTVAKKPAAKKTATTKKVAKKPAAKKAASKKPATKKAPTKKPTTKKPATSKAAPKSKAAAAKDAKSKADEKKTGRKGITIVSDKPARRSKPQPPKASKFPPPGPRLLGPGSKLRKPLIPSGSSARPTNAIEESATSKRKKTPFTKKQLDNYKAILIVKRAELIGDVEQMETDALRSNSGGLSNTPQHMAEQGSDSADQSLNLNLAAADRRLIKEIDAALARIADRTFGLCKLTNEPISKERLEELPWAEYSIEAARQLEQRGGVR